MGKRRLTPQTRKRIQDAVDAELKAAGLGALDEISEILAQAGGDDLPMLMEAGILLGIKKHLFRETEPSKEELASILSKIENKLRYKFRSTFADSFAQIKKRLPRRPGGGRKKVLATEQEKNEACDAVSELVRKKVPFKTAFARVALRFTARLGHNVSARSVQRAWQGRDEEKGPTD
jgi:hypothetical protein